MLQKQNLFLKKVRIYYNEYYNFYKMKLIKRVNLFLLHKINRTHM